MTGVPRRRLALFDLDGTLLTVSSERRFAWHLARLGALGPRQAFAYALFLLRWARHFGRDVGRRNKAYLAGLDRAQIGEWAERFVAAELGHWLYTPCVARLQRHLAAGDHVVLLTGTLAAIAEPLARTLSIPRVVATIPAFDGERYAAAPPEQHPLGIAKRLLAERLCREYRVGFEDVIAYADSWHDLPLLEAAGRPVAVRPDRALAAIARAHDWEIIDDRAAPMLAANSRPSA